MYKYKIDVAQALKDRGYTTYKLKQTKAISQGSFNKLKNQQHVNLETLNAVCIMLDCQISDIIEIQAAEAEKVKFCKDIKNEKN